MQVWPKLTRSSVASSQDWLHFRAPQTGIIYSFSEHPSKPFSEHPSKLEKHVAGLRKNRFQLRELAADMVLLAYRGIVVARPARWCSRSRALPGTAGRLGRLGRSRHCRPAVPYAVKIRECPSMPFQQKLVIYC